MVFIASVNISGTLAKCQPHSANVVLDACPENTRNIINNNKCNYRTGRGKSNGLVRRIKSKGKQSVESERHKEGERYT